MEKYRLIVPTIPKDVGKLLQNIDVYFKYLPIKEICVIGNKELEGMLPKHYHIAFLDEKKLVEFKNIRNLIEKRTKNDKAGRRTGWYVQQFIKMGFARVCDDDYYLLWDSDTVPVKPVNMLENDVPIFDCKTEHHEAYFRTIDKLFPNLKKSDNGSFISEHMLIKTSLMREMLDEIELNTDLKGENFEEKIINAVPLESLAESGFSEFETFGTFINSKYPNFYKIRNWKSMRFGGFFYDCGKDLTSENLNWLANKYDAISFEKGDNISPVSKIVNSSWYKKTFKANTLEGWAFLIRAYRKISGKR